jgi:hypothetical protein
MIVVRQYKESSAQTAFFACVLAATLVLVACTGGTIVRSQATTGGSNGSGGLSGTGGGTGKDGSVQLALGGSSGLTLLLDAAVSDVPTADVPTVVVGDPTTCEMAAQYKTYVGCEYWPTVVANNTWSIFDFAAVVANGQNTPADVTVTGPKGFKSSTSVAAKSLAKIYLPWVTDLKGPDPDNCGTEEPLSASVVSVKGAYHLVSSIPVTVYQFNPLEYKAAGGPAGKSWSNCPGKSMCESASSVVGCYSFSSDASLLLPTTALTGSYRISGVQGWSGNDFISGHYDIQGGYFAVTATADNTTVKVKLSAQGKTLAGGSIPAAAANGVFSFTLQQGDVAQITSPIGEKYDFSGSQVDADKPVQIIAGIPCVEIPQDVQSCDHVEETVLPAQTWGQHYVVTVPTGPRGAPVGHVVRFYGNVDGTNLTYLPSVPKGCPATLNAGQVVDCGRVNADFEVKGDHEFTVSGLMLGAEIVDPLTTSGTQRSKGDPSLTLFVAVEQYRKSYIFLAPDDYDVAYVDIVGPTGVSVTLDGAPVSTPFSAIGTSGFGVARVQLGPGQSGSHTMTSDQPAGIQVMGYGFATSYQYPGGLNLSIIAPPLPPVPLIP